MAYLTFKEYQQNGFTTDSGGEELLCSTGVRLLVACTGCRREARGREAKAGERRGGGRRERGRFGEGRRIRGKPAASGSSWQPCRSSMEVPCPKETSRGMSRGRGKQRGKRRGRETGEKRRRRGALAWCSATREGGRRIHRTGSRQGAPWMWSMLLFPVQQGRGEQGRSERARERERETGMRDSGVSPTRSGVGRCGREAIAAR